MTEEEKKEINKNEKWKIPAFRTFKTDSSKYIQKKDISIIDIAASQARAGKRFEDKTPPPKKYVIPLLILLPATVALLATAWYLFFKRPQPVIPPGSLPKPIILAEDEKEVVVNPDISTDNASKIKKALHSSVPAGENKLVYIPIITVTITEDNLEKKSLIKPKDFFNIFDMIPPTGFYSGIEDRFMLAKFETDQNLPVLILKIKSYDNSFASMIKWENSLVQDFSPLFEINSNSGLDTFFQDKELKNKDVRIVYNEENEPIFLYSFINRNYLIITTSQVSLEEIFRRFRLPQYFNG